MFNKKQISLLFLFFIFNLFGQLNSLSKDKKVDIKVVTFSGQSNNFYIIVETKLLGKWNLYWRQSGGIPQGTYFNNFNLPKGISLKNISYPTPNYKFNKSANFTQVFYIYEKSPQFLLEFSVDDSYKNKQVIGNFNMSYQACTKAYCALPENKKLIFNILLDKNHAEYAFPFLYEVKEKLPKKLPHNLGLIRKKKRNKLIFSFPKTKNFKDVKFFPNFKHIANDVQQWTEEKGVISLEVVFSKKDKIIDKGVLKIIGNKVVSYLVEEEEKNLEDLDKKTDKNNFLFYLCIGFLGGLLLNFMPCVFPILAIKIISFVEQTKKKKFFFIKYAIFFTSGVLISFWVLAGIIFIFKQVNGEILDWGFQLQNPYFMCFLISLLIVMALNFWGIFEIIFPWTPQIKEDKSYKGAFLNGLLTTLIATPCMAPFMSVALVAALNLPIFKAMIIFTSLGLGLASPYIIFAIFPSLVKWVPKPGVWMVIFKQFLGFLLFASAIWFMKTFAILMGIDLLIYFILLLVLLSLGFWFYGHYSLDRTSKGYKLSFILLVVNILFFVLVMAKEISYKTYIDGFSEEEKNKILRQRQIVWQEFSEEKFNKLKQDGKKIFINFTATWCASCVWNEKVILIPNRQLFYDNDIIMLKADCTKATHSFKNFLKEYEAVGVPLYLYFDGEKIHKLENILTDKIIRELF